MTLAKMVTKTLDVGVKDTKIDLSATIKSYDLTDTKFIFNIISNQGLNIDLTGSKAMYIVEYAHNFVNYAIKGNVDIVDSTTIAFSLPEDLKGYRGNAIIGLYVQMADGTKIDLKDIVVKIEPSIIDKGIDFSARTYFEDFETVKAEVILEGEKVKTNINAVVSDVNGYADSQKQAINNIVSDVQSTGDTAKEDIKAVLPTLQGQVSQLSESISELKGDIGEVFTIGKNQFDINNLVNKLYSNTGELTDNPSYLLTDFIDVSSKQGYYIASNYNGYFVQFDNNKAFINKIDNILYTNNRRIGSYTAYIRIGLGKKISEIQDETLWIEKEKITETPIYDKYGKNINDDINVPHDNSKVDKSQGTENSGKYLKIGEDGNIAPDEAPIDSRMYVGEKIPNGGTKDGDQTISIGQGACRDDKCGIIAIGVDAASKTTSTDSSDNGHYSIAIGHRALSKNQSGHHNTAIGWGAMANNLDGYGNTAVGEDALCHSISGNSNVCIGNRAYQMGTGSRNVVIGATAMYSSAQGKVPTGDANVAVGTGAGQDNGAGDYNTNIGTGATSDDDLRYTTTIGAAAKAHKSRQVVIGSTKAGSTHTIETILNGDIIICGTDMKFRKLILNDDGTIKWEDVSANYSNYIN